MPHGLIQEDGGGGLMDPITDFLAPWRVWWLPDGARGRRMPVVWRVSVILAMLTWVERWRSDEMVISLAV